MRCNIRNTRKKSVLKFTIDLLFIVLILIEISFYIFLHVCLCLYSVHDSLIRFQEGNITSEKFVMISNKPKNLNDKFRIEKGMQLLQSMKLRVVHTEKNVETSNVFELKLIHFPHKCSFLFYIFCVR